MRKQMKKYFCCIILTFFTWNIVECFAGQFVGKTGSAELRERVYVQTDKQLYLAGEPVLMKVLTTDTEQIPLTFSKIAYVELIGDSVAQAQIKIELTGGIGTGRMQLAADLPTGYYRLIAYTQFMRNEGVDVFFEKNIAIVNTFVSGYHPEDAEQVAENHISPAEETGSGTVMLQPDKANYSTRDHGELIISGLPEKVHTLSVSVAGKDFVSVGESDISTFQKNRTKKSTKFTGEFLPEYEGHIVTGKIIDNQTGMAGANELLAAGLAFPSEGIRFFAAQKSNVEDVRFFTSNISGMNEIATVVYNTNENYRVEIQSPFVNRYASETMPALRLDSAYFGRLLHRSVALQVFHYFSEDLSKNRNIPEQYLKMKPTWSYLLDEYTRFTTMREVFIEFIIGARFRKNANKQEISVLVKRGNYYNYGMMPLVMLDGVPVSDHDAIYNYDPLTVERINIYYGPCVLGGYMFDGIVEMTTYRRLHQDLHLSKSSQILTYEGPQLPYRLDTPDYSEEKNRRSRMPDGRHTLLWNPDVCPDGKTSIRLPFDTSDLTGEFQATVEGVTEDGQFIYTTAVFKVEDNT